MTYTTALIMEWLSSIVWPLARVSGLLMVMAVFGSRLTPARVRISLALALTLMIALCFPMPRIELFSVGSFLVLGQQLLIGVALGLMTQFLMESFVMAGQIIAMQTSLGFATLVDPMNGQSAPVVGQFYLMLATLVFLAVDGHLIMLRMVVLSFDTLPVSDSGLSLPSIRDLIGFSGHVSGPLVMALCHRRPAAHQLCLRRHDPCRTPAQHLQHRLCGQHDVGPADPLAHHWWLPRPFRQHVGAGTGDQLYPHRHPVPGRPVRCRR